jgi:hypothetical protein
LWGLTGQQWFCLGLLLAIGLYYAYQYGRSRQLLPV